MSAAVSGSIVWFCVAMMPFCIRVLTTAATRSAMRLASSCTVIASGTCTSRTTFSRSPEWLATRRLSRSCRRFIAASERWRPSSSVALAMVRRPRERRSSSPLPRLRFSSTAGALSPTFFGPTGRPASARAAIACAAAGSTGAGVASRAADGDARWSRCAASACSAAAAAARCSWISSSLARRSAASFSARSRVSSAARASAASFSRWRRSASWAFAASTAFRRRSNSASERFGVVPPGRPGCWPAGAPGFGTRIRLRLCSTVTDLVRPWLKLWRTWLVSVPPLRSPSVLPFRSPSLISVIPSSLSRGSLPPPNRPPRRPWTPSPPSRPGCLTAAGHRP